MRGPEKDSPTSAALQLASEVAKPIYRDALEPAAKQIGKSLELAGRTVNAALLPLAGLVWGFEQVAEFVKARLAEKLSHLSEDQIRTPDPMVAGPAMEALRFTGQHEELREMFVNLMATAMDVTKGPSPHPAFVETLRQISPEEAKLLSVLDPCPSRPVYPLSVELSWDASGLGIQGTDTTGFGVRSKSAGDLTHDVTNLVRLGILSPPNGAFFTVQGQLNQELLKSWRTDFKLRPTINNNSLTVLLPNLVLDTLEAHVSSLEGTSRPRPDRTYGKVMISELTDFGEAFYKAVVGPLWKCGPFSVQIEE